MPEIPSNSMLIKGELLSTLTMELLRNDAAECVQIETTDGFLVKVLPVEQDLETCPYDLQSLIAMAREENKDWLHISQVPPGPACEFRFNH